MEKYVKYILIPLFLVLLMPIQAMGKSKAQALSTIIFDCDGVLVDTEYLKFQAWQRALAEYHVDITIEDYIPLIGNDGKYILSAFLATKKRNLPTDEVLEKRKNFYTALAMQGVPPIPSAILFAKQLAAKKSELGIKLALASSASYEEIMRNLRAIGLADAFDVIISGHDDLKDIQDPEGTNKPKPYIYQRLAQWLKVKPSECLVFEDTNAGVMSAYTAGMPVIAVPNHLTQLQDFSKATRIINSFDELNVNKMLHQYGERNEAIQE